MADPNFSDVVLLCHFDGTSGQTTFTDTSSYAHTLTATGATITTTAPRFGTGAGDFITNAGAGIDTGNSAHFNFGAGQFTVEGWGYFTSAPNPGAVYGVVTQFGSSANLGWFFGHASGQLAFYYSTTGFDNPSVGASYSPTLNTWIHLAADRDASNVLRVYANGMVIASATVASAFFASTQSCLIGNDHNHSPSRAFPGHLDDLRVTKGVARYAGAFTPPTAAFDDDTPPPQPPNALLLFTGFAPTPLGSGIFSVTQIGAEAWVSNNPTANFTQIGAEAWVSNNPAMLATQIGAEAWTKINLASSPAPGALTFTGFAPSVPFFSVPGAGALTFTGFAPANTTSSVPPSGALLFTGFAPAPVMTGSSSPPMFAIIV